MRIGKVLTLLQIDYFAHSDIYRRLYALGPEYIQDYVRFDNVHGPVIVFNGEVGLVVDPTTIPTQEN